MPPTCRPGNVREPNNMIPPEFCVVANATQSYGTPSGWGWADTGCSGRHVFICRQLPLRGYQFTTSRNEMFIFNTSAAPFGAAEQSCRENGGQLASYRYVCRST
jgi:hypothetical protein